MSIRVCLVAALLLTACPSADSCKSKNDCFKGFECVNAVCVATDAGSSAGGGTSTAGGSASAGGVTAGGTGGGSAGGAVGGGTVSTDGESCARPNVLSLPSTLTATTMGTRNDVSLRCTGFSNPGPDLVYSATVPAGQRLVVSIEPTERDAGLVFDPSLSIVSGPAANCTSTDAGVCLVGRDERGADTAVWLNEDVFEREVFVIVDSYLTEPDQTAGSTFQGAFSLSARLEVPGAGDRCETAETAPANGTRQSTLSGYGPDYRFAQSTGCSIESGPDRVFAVDVPAGERLVATATPAPDAGIDIVVNLVAAPAATCRASPPVCLASADRGFRDEADSATFINNSTTTQSLFVVVGSYFAMPSGGDFTLTTTSVPPPPGDTCSTATTLVVGTPLMAQTLTGYGDDVSSGTTCASGGTGGDRFYALTIPGGKQLTVTVTPQATLDTVLSIIDAAGGCASPLTCLTGAPSSALGQVDQLFFTNRNTTPLAVLVAVDSRAGGSGTFDLSATIADPPAGDFCGIANTLTLDAGVAGTTLGATNDYEDGDRCASGFTGPDTTYAFDIPAGQRATLTVTPTSGDGGFNPSLSIVPAPATSCEANPRVCIGAGNAAFGSTAPRTATAYNAGTTPLSTFVIVDGSSASSGTFTLSATAATPAVNDVCTTATATLSVTPSTSTQPLTGQTLTGFTRDYDCVSFASGADRVYGAQVAALQRVSITVTPTPNVPDAGSFDPVFSVIGGPSARCDSATRVCLGQVDDGAQGSAETLVINHVGASQQVFVAVGSYESAPIDSTFSIVATSEPLLDGEVCEKPIPISVTNTRSGDSLRGLLRDYDLTGATCSSSFGDDAVYAVTFTNSFTITVTPDAMSDAVLNVLDGPAGSCAAATACLARADQGGDGAAEVVSLVNTTGAPRTVFLVVSAFSAGEMTFSVAATIN
jgi:hypothetical protein